MKWIDLLASIREKITGYSHGLAERKVKIYILLYFVLLVAQKFFYFDLKNI